MKKVSILATLVLFTTFAFSQTPSRYRIKNSNSYGWKQRVVPTLAFLDSTLAAFHNIKDDGTSWVGKGNAVGNHTTFIGSTDNFSISVKTNNATQMIFGNTGNHTMNGALAINGNSLATNLYIETDNTGNVFPFIINSGSGANSYAVLQGTNISSFIFKNLVSGNRWFVGNQTVAGATYDNFAISNATNPDVGSININWNDGHVKITKRLAVGSVATTTPNAQLQIGAGSTSLPPIRLTSGALPTGTNIVGGNIAFLTDKIYFTRTTSTVVVEFEQTLSTTATLDFASTAAQAVSALTVAVTNAADGDPVEVGVPVGSSTATNAQWVGRVTSAGVVTVYFQNNNLVTVVDPASGTYRILVKKN